MIAIQALIRMDCKYNMLFDQLELRVGCSLFTLLDGNVTDGISCVGMDVANQAPY